MNIIRINLLPPEARPQQPVGVLHYIAAAGVVAAVAGGSFYYQGMIAERERVLGEAQERELRLSQVQQGLERAREIAERERRVAEEEAALRGLEGRDWSPLLMAMADLTPAGMTWEKLAAGPDGIAVAGTVAGLGDLAQFVTGLSASPHVERVDLVDYAEDPERGRFTFHLTVRLQADAGETSPGEAGQDDGQSEPA